LQIPVNQPGTRRNGLEAQAQQNGLRPDFTDLGDWRRAMADLGDRRRTMGRAMTALSVLKRAL
jgi:hypothetical protein